MTFVLSRSIKHQVIKPQPYKEDRDLCYHPFSKVVTSKMDKSITGST